MKWTELPYGVRWGSLAVVGSGTCVSSTRRRKTCRFCIEIECATGYELDIRGV